MKRTTIFWITVLVLGWLFDLLFWGHAPGINFAIYTVLVLAGGLIVLGLNGYRASWRTLVLLVPILFFAAMTFIRQETMSMFLAFVFTIGLMGLMAVSYLGGLWFRYSLADYLLNFLKLAGSMIARPISFFVETRKTAVPQDTPATGGKSKAVWSVVRGVVIAIPVVVIFVALLASADLVFAQRVHDFTQLFRLENLPQYIFRGIYILVGTYLLAGTFLHAARKSQDEKLTDVEKPLVTPFLGFTEAAIVMGAVVVLFALFAAVQFRYFFGGQTNIGIQGYTYAEYARKGFGELVTVAFFSLLLFLGLSSIVKRKNAAQRWVFSGLGIGMVALVGVMLVSAYQRLVLYETAYGFSRLRMYTHIFMIWLGLLLAVVVVLEILRKERTFALATLLASIGFAATLALLNVDGFIVQQNVRRAPGGNGLDVAYLASLSTDAVPTLVKEFQDPSLPQETREAVGAVLVCRTKNNAGTRDDNWRSFMLSNWLADQAMQQIQSQLSNFQFVDNSQLSNYQIVDNEWPYTVMTPSQVKYECNESGGM